MGGRGKKSGAISSEYVGGGGSAVSLIGGSGGSAAVSGGSAKAEPAAAAAKPEEKKPAEKEPVKKATEQPQRPRSFEEPRQPLDSYKSIYTDSPDYPKYRLESDERFAVKLTQPQQAALKVYKGSGYFAINRELRGLSTPTEHNQKIVQRIDKALEKQSLGQDLVLYRGFTSPAVHKKGLIFRDDGFMSTSLNPNSAFSGDTVIRIHAPKGTKGAFIDTKRTYNKAAGKGELYTAEHEVLLARKTRYKVVGESTVKTAYGSRKVWDVVIVKDL